MRNKTLRSERERGKKNNLMSVSIQLIKKKKLLRALVTKKQHSDGVSVSLCLQSREALCHYVALNRNLKEIDRKSSVEGAKGEMGLSPMHAHAQTHTHKHASLHRICVLLCLTGSADTVAHVSRRIPIIWQHNCPCQTGAPLNMTHYAGTKRKATATR